MTMCLKISAFPKKSKLVLKKQRARANNLATRRNRSSVDVVGSVGSETPAGKGLPESALVGTSVPVDISLDPCITSSKH